MTEETTVIPAPKGLKIDGRRFWKAVVKEYKLRPDEQIVLQSACKTIDQITELESAMVGQPLVTKGSMGQEREHPLLSEVRQQRALLARAVAQLKLPDPTSGAKVNQQREAAQSRWAAAHGGAS